MSPTTLLTTLDATLTQATDSLTLAYTIQQSLRALTTPPEHLWRRPRFTT
jgi:hypothetical protein